MDYIRLLPRQHWDARKGRFISLAFKPSSIGGGISVIAVDCAEERSGSICRHIKHYHPSQPSESVIFWRISTELWKHQGLRFERTPVPDGDPCHADITGIDVGTARDLFKEIARDNGISKFEICSDGVPRQLERKDLDILVV